MIGRVDWDRGTGVDGVDDRVAVDRTGHRLPKRRAVKPGTARIRRPRGRQIEPQLVRIDADPGVDQAERAPVGEPLEADVVLRADLAIGHQVQVAALHPDGLGVLVTEKKDRQRVEVRKRGAGRVLAPVAGISREGQALARDVRGKDEWAEARDLGER